MDNQITANSIQQFNKWKSWERGEIMNIHMFPLATTYFNEICGLCHKLGLHQSSLTDDEVFNLVAKHITPPVEVA